MVMNQPFRFSAIFIWVLVLCSATIQTAHAQILPTSCSTTTIDMKLLVVSNGKTESDYPAIKQILDYLGTPYDVLDMTVSTGGITSSMLSDGSCHGYYQGVIFAYGAYIYTLPGMSLLTSYEQAFGVRQLNWYMYPNNDFGYSYPYLMHDLVLAYGLINWVTKGMFLGEYHVYAAAQVDDFFINGSEWIPGTPCTDPKTHDRTPPDATSLPFFRINSADMTSLVAWQNKIQSAPLLSNFKLTLAFNGVGTTGNTDWTGLPAAGIANDTLTTSVQNYQQYFHWISHTYDHPNSLNGLHKSDPGGDPDTPQVDSIDLEILTNQYVATGTGQNLNQDPSDTVSPLHLTDFNPATLVTPGVPGLNDTLFPTN